MNLFGRQGCARQTGSRPALLVALSLALLAAAPHLRAQTLAMRHFDNRDGVPQSQVTALLEDHLGFIWASTADGLVRLGPNEPQLYDSTNGMTAKDVSDLLEDREGAIWVATQERGLMRIRGREVASFGAGQGLLEPNVHCLAQGARDDLFVGTQQGLYRRRGERFERVALPGDWASMAIAGLAEDAQGGLWLGARGGALARWDGVRLQAATLPEAARSGSILRLQTDPAGRIWALQAERLLRLDPGGAWVVASLPGLPATAVFTGLTFDHAGGLLVAMGTDGLYLWEPGGQGRILPPRELPCRDALNCALRDREGGLWLGTDGDYLWAQPFAGLHNLARDPDTGADLGLGTVTSFLARPGGAMLAGSNNGVFLWRPGRGLAQHWSRANGLTSQDVWTLHDDGQGGAWIGTMKGLYRLVSGARIVPGPAELAKVQIMAMVRQGGRFWLGTGKGLVELGEDGQFRGLYDPVAQVGYSAINCLLAEEDGLLVGTGQGLLRFRGGRFEPPFREDPTHQLQILALHQEPGGRLWVGTSQGLQVRDPHSGRWSSLGLEANGTPLYAITWIRGLANGTFAVGHAKGVTLVNAAGAGFALTRRMGLLSNETNQDAALEDGEGRLWMGMVGGISILDARKGFPVLPAPTPVVLDLTWEKGHFWLPAQATLPRGFATLSIQIDAGLPNTPFPVRYEVRQEGTPWHALDPGRASIYFEGLSAGTHRLRFRGSLNGTDWREAAPLDVTILPAWYRTAWAEAALAGLLGLGALLALRLRTRHLQRRNQDLEAHVAQRTRALEGTALELARKNQSLEWTHGQLKDTLESRLLMINTVSHDLRSPLTSILLSMDQIQEAAEGASPRIQKAFGIMAQEARRLDGIVKGLLDRNRAESLADRLVLQPATPQAILDKLEDTLTLKGEGRGLRTHLSLEPGSLDAAVLLDVTAMQQVLFNLVENALKFTEPPGDVGVRSTLEAGHWVLEVWDTGRGIPRSECERLFRSYQQGEARDAKAGWGLGLFICRSIVAAHGGVIEVDSDTGKGAIFKVLIPLQEAPAGVPLD